MSTTNQVLGGKKQTPNPYVDNFGEYNSIHIQLINDSNNNRPDDYNIIKLLPKTQQSYYNNVIKHLDKTYQITKDAYEHHHFTYEVSIVSKDKEIVIGYGLTQINALIQQKSEFIMVYVSMDEKYSINSKNPIGTHVDSTLTIYNNRLQIGGSYFINNRNSIKSWGVALGSARGNMLLLGVNKIDNEIIGDRVYFNYKTSID